MEKIYSYDSNTTLRLRDPIVKYTGLEQVRELEAVYGKYIYVPLDIPIIKPKDLEAFVSWYKSKSIVAEKIKPNISNPNIGVKFYKTINSAYYSDESWTSNVVDDTFRLFPELKEQVLEYYPIIYLNRWRLWSSVSRIVSHRDQDSLVDFPICLRTKLYDTNPSETLWLRTDCPWDGKSDLPNLGPHTPMITDGTTNSFAWNNIRIYHGSNYDPNFFKILWIVTIDSNLHVNRYIDLMDRSISKYNSTIMVDKNSSTVYYND